jgi:hypothetical protein
MITPNGPPGGRAGSDYPCACATLSLPRPGIGCAWTCNVCRQSSLQLTSFIGREREIDEVKHLVTTTRLLTLTGAGGCGKTEGNRRLELYPALGSRAGVTEKGICIRRRLVLRGR